MNEISTSAVMAEFGKMADTAYEWERDGLGTWMAFENPDQSLPVIVAAPKHGLESAGCTVFFRHAVDEAGAKDAAQKLTRNYKLQEPIWMTVKGDDLII